ncbi:MAG TPA: FlgD immunoglobulin-like domain containing protein, partial [Spirochaetia bacterium]
IDRILVTTSLAVNKSTAAFAGFSVQVTGYTLTTVGGEGGTVFNWSDAADGRQFYIMLEEKTYLDSNVTPSWKVTVNTTLNDAGVGTYYVPVDGTVFTPTDAAPPVLAYTLSVVGSNQMYVKFSEPITNGGSALAFGDFTFSDLTLTATALSQPSSSEAILTLSRVVTADDQVTPTMLQLPSTLQDIATTPNAITLASGGHRISDVGLGLPGASLLEPVWARDESIRTAAAGVGYITAFDGTKWLRTGNNLTLEGNISTLTALNYGGGTQAYPLAGTTKLYWDMDVASTLATSSGLWLPGFADDTTAFGGFSGLIPTAATGNAAARSVADSTQPSDRLRDYVISKNDSKNVDGAALGFLFSIPQSTSFLYTASVPDPSSDSSWYQHMKPWEFDLHSIRPQRGGVQILNNVINPDRGDAATLQYTLASSGQVTVTVFDLAGSIVNVLVRTTQGAGDYEVTWDGKNRGKKNVTRGIYFVRIVAPGIDEIRKVLVVR